MKIVIFGLTISSSWGNGHATLWRGLCRAMSRRGHDIVFFERDVHYYAAHRDLPELGYGTLVLYPKWEDIVTTAKRHSQDADVVMITSYCPDAVAAAELSLSSPADLKVFYDLDTPVTLEKLRHGEPVGYLPPQGLRDFDVILSYTGGLALDELMTRLGARRTAPLYGSVDPDNHFPVLPVDHYRADLSYLGTYAEDRQQALIKFFIEPARRLSGNRFVIGGAQYPQEFPWTDNIFFVRHLPPAEHPAFFCSSQLTLNITRQAMAEMGYCPSGRLFEAAACGTPLLSDWWEGLDEFFKPNSEIIIAQKTEDVLDALQLSDAQLQRISHAARERTLSEHTAEKRAIDLERILENARSTAAEPSIQT